MTATQSSTSPRFRLSDWEGVAKFQTIRDSSFSQLGIMKSRRSSTLFPYFDETYLGELLSNPNLSAAITTEKLAAGLPDQMGVATCEAPMEAFLRLHLALASDQDYVGLNFPTRIGAGSSIHPQASVADKGVSIGRNAVIGPHAVILPGAVLGDDVTVQPSAIIASDGYEVRDLAGEPFSVPHIGRAVIGNRVLVGYQSIIDRALYRDDTEVGDMTKIGPLCIIGHGCRIGQRCRITSRVSVAGATVIGNDVIVGPSSTISNTLTIGDGARVVIGEVVTRDVPTQMVAMRNSVITNERYREICHLGAKSKAFHKG